MVNKSWDRHLPCKGLTVSLYKPATGPDGSRGGLSTLYDQFVLTGPGIPLLTPPSMDYPELCLEEKYEGHLRAVPAILAGEHVQFGGCFVYSCDSRFPTGLPIKLFDRVEHLDQWPPIKFCLHDGRLEAYTTLKDWFVSVDIETGEDIRSNLPPGSYQHRRFLREARKEMSCVKSFVAAVQKRIISV